MSASVAALIWMLVLAKSATAQEWFVSTVGSELKINYGTPANNPQYAVLHLNDSYFRMNYGPGSVWGTSVVVMPSYWSGGSYYQGSPVVGATQASGANLVLTLDGTSNGLATHLTITLAPPSNNALTATVAASLTGSVPLDNNRPGEAFKPVFMSSMHDSDTIWDASAAFVESATYSLGSGGWIVPPSPVVTGAHFGLLGGTSAWKTNATSVSLDFGGPIQVAGYLAPDSDPNNDNVGFWAASDTILTSWSYSIVANDATAIPEPTTYALFSICALGLTLVRHRR